MRYLFFFLLITTLCSCKQADTPTPLKQTIVFLRHGEKPLPPDSDHEQLSCLGWNRALALPKILTRKFGKPNYILAPSTTLADVTINPKYSYDRPLSTIEPTAISLNMPVDMRFVYNDDQGVANTLLTEPYHHALIFVAWERHNLVNIARNIMSLLNAQPQLVPDWSSEDFDSLYVINIDWQQQKPIVEFKHEQADLTTKLDATCAEKIVSPQPPIVQDDTQTIYFLAAGEGTEFGQLNCKGLNRAILLSQTLNLDHLGNNIDYFFAPSPSGSFNFTEGKNNFYLRGLMTLVPTVISQNQPLYTLFGYKEIEAMRKHLLSENFHNKTLIVSWDSLELPNLLKAVTNAIGSDLPLISTTQSNDIIYKLIINRNNHKIISSHFSYQKQNLHPANSCLMS